MNNVTNPNWNTCHLNKKPISPLPKMFSKYNSLTFGKGHSYFPIIAIFKKTLYLGVNISHIW